MPTRFNSNSTPRFGVSGIADKTHQGSPEFSIPSVGIEDVDVALFNLFDKEIPLQTSGENSAPKKVPVIFASGEKWALLKRKKAIRDKNNSLILPLITIVRDSIEQESTNDITGRGINQQTNEIVIKRRLDKSDRRYQNLINKHLLKNQLNVATNPEKEHVAGQLLTDRQVGKEAEDPAFIDGAWLSSSNKNNIFETIVIPSPQFYTVHYNLTLWAQYTQHMNQLIEQLISSFLPQGNSWQLKTPKGYWFIANVDNNSYQQENNTDDMSRDERLLKHNFSVVVRAYIFASSYPGTSVPIKRYVSSPIIQFTSDVAGSGTSLDSANIVEDPFLGSDDPTLPLTDGATRSRDQRQVGTRLYKSSDNFASDDPAQRSRMSKESQLFKKVVTQNSAGKDVETYARVFRVSSASGETVIKPISQRTAPSGGDSTLGDLLYETSK